MPNQKIYCQVNSCKHLKNTECSLDSITVTPCENCQTGSPRESMCSSYHRKGQC